MRVLLGLLMGVIAVVFYGLCAIAIYKITEGDRTVLDSYGPGVVWWMQGLPCWRHGVWFGGCFLGIMGGLQVICRERQGVWCQAVAIAVMISVVLLYDYMSEKGAANYGPVGLVLLLGLAAIAILIMLMSSAATRKPRPPRACPA